MPTYAFYISNAPGPDRQLIGLPNGGVAYIRATMLDVNVQPDEALLAFRLLRPGL